jgi:hypothetical protein
MGILEGARVERKWREADVVGEHRKVVAHDRADEGATT